MATSNCLFQNKPMPCSEAFKLAFGFGHRETIAELPEGHTNSLPEDADLRNSYPMADGLLDYFPNALAEVSRVSFIGNQQHNPGQPMHWAREKSTDHRNKILRHLVDAGGKDSKGVRHSAYLAWRALANLQAELEDQEGYPRSRASK